MAEFDDALQSNGSPKLAANSAVTDRMVEAAWTAYVEARDGRPMHAAIEAALREQPEPVAWRTFDGKGGWELIYYKGNESYRLDYIKRNGERYASWVEPLYAHPPESHSEAYCQSETIRMQDKELNELRAALEGQTTPDKLIEQAEPVTWDWLPSDARDKWVIGAPQRKPLTEEEIVRLDEPVADVPWERVLKFVRRIERAHGIGGEE